MTEKVSDVVSQLEAALVKIEHRTAHDGGCSAGYLASHGYCDCTWRVRMRTEIARCVVESWKSSVLGYRFPPDATSHVVPLHAHRLEALKRGRALSFDDPLEVGAAAFRATQEQENVK